MKFLFSLLAVFMLNAACDSAKSNLDSTKNMQTELKGTYTIAEVNSENLEGNNITISFDSSTNKVSGFAGCNRFFGNYSVKNNTISFKNIGTTKKYCLDKENTVEKKVLDALNSASNFKIKDKVLTLLSKNRVLLMSASKSDFSKAPSKSDLISNNYSKSSVTYKANSRGFFKQITVSEGKITIYNDYSLKDKITSICKPADWRLIQSIIDKLDAGKISKLKPPSTKHRYDGAPHANLTIVKGDVEVTSPSFDHGNPPKEIESLVNKLLSLAETKKN